MAGKAGKYQHLTHEFAPVYDANSRILILGSFPSVKSQGAAVFLRTSAEPLLEGACSRFELQNTADDPGEKGDAPFTWNRTVGCDRRV